MIGSRRVVCVIPARLESSRFPRKLLKSLAGKPILQWVWESARDCASFDEVLFAVDSEEIATLVEGFGGKWVMTSKSCANGTRRLIEVMERRLAEGDIWVSWQGDEPLIHEGIIMDLLPTEKENCEGVWTLRKRIESLEEIDNPSVVKVVADANGRALYFSRYPIPFSRDGYERALYKHLGLYAYSKQALEKIGRLPSSEIEESEGLEQLGFLYHGIHIQVHDTNYETCGIDTEEDLKMAEEAVASSQNQRV